MPAPTRNHSISWEIIDSPCCYPFLEQEKDAGMLKKRPKLVEEVQKCKRLKFDSIFLTSESPIDKENSI
jgi:hypothetical protein